MENMNQSRGSAKSTLLGIMVVLIVGMGLGLYLGKHSQEFKLADLWQRMAPVEKPRAEKPGLPAPTPPAPPLPAGNAPYEQAIIAAAARAMPAVVNVSTEKTVQLQVSPFYNDPFFRRFFSGQGGGPATKRRESGLGSGVIVSPDGYILTNNHVVAGMDKVKVLLGDQRTFKAKVIGADPKSDVALIKIEATNLPSLPLGDSDQIQVGQSVLAIGNPFGLNQTVTLGIISAKGRSRVGIAEYEDFIQTDAAINPGNSGGALVNLRGELIGINTAIASQSGGYQGVGFAVPSNMAKMVMNSLLKNGRVIRGWLGVSMQEITPDLAQSLGLKDARGALVADVAPGDPADKAGLKAGDVIVESNGKPVQGMMRFRNEIAETAPGASLALKVLRNGKSLDLTLVVGELKEKSEAGAKPESESEGESPLGISARDLTPDLAQRLNLDPDQRGVVITHVEPGSRADEAGLAEGDVIISVDHVPVENVEGLRRALKQNHSGPILFAVSRQGSNQFFAVPQP
jgi:serine protease Do